MKRFSPFHIWVFRLAAPGILLCALAPGLAAQTATFAGALSTLGTGFMQPGGIATDSAGDLFVTDELNNTVMRIDAVTGTQTVLASDLKNPSGVAVDAAGYVYVSDTGNNRVVVVPPNGGPQLVAVPAGVSSPVQIALDSAGNLYVADNGGGRVVKFSVDGSAPVNVVTGLADAQGVAVDGAGNVYASDNENSVVYRITPGGTKTTVSTGFIATQLAVDAAGNLFIAGDGGVEEAPGGTGTPVGIPFSLGYGQGIAVDQRGRLFVSSGGQKTINEVQTKSVDFGSVPVCAKAKQFTPACSQTITLTFNVTLPAQIFPNSVSATSPSVGDFIGNESETCGVETSGPTCTLVLTFSPVSPGLRRSAAVLGDNNNGALATVEIFGTGIGSQLGYYGANTPTTVGTGFNLPTGVVVDGQGDVFVADTLNNRVEEIPASGGAQFEYGGVAIPFPAGLALDGAGNLYVTLATNSELLFIPGPGLGDNGGTIPAPINEPVGDAVDAMGNVYIASSGTGTVVELHADGSASTTVGTGLVGPYGVAVDGAGNVYIADSGGNDVVEVPADGGAQFTIGGGLNKPQGVAVDAAGDVFVSDSGNNRVVEMPAGGGAQFTVLSGLKAPAGLALDSAGTLYIADTENNRVLKLENSLPATLKFPSTKVGSSSAAQSLVVENVGTSGLNITNVAYPADFPVDFAASATETLCSGDTALAPGGTCELSFSFTPLGSTPSPEHFTMTDNLMNAAGSKQTIALSGTAILNQSIVFLLPASTTFSPTAINLATEAAATSGLPVSFKLVSGPAKLSGSTITFTGAGRVVIQASQAGNAAYAAATAVTKAITVAKATPTITWAIPAAIVYGTKLSAAQLDAVASAAGKLVYTPAPGAVPPAGAQTLSVTFTPTNTAGYASVTKTVKITVTKAVLTVTAANVTIQQGAAIPKFTPSYSGFVNGDTAAKALTGAPALTTTATASSPAGSYAITVKQGTLAAKNYSFTLKNGVLTISASSVVKKDGGIPAPVPPREPRHLDSPQR